MTRAFYLLMALDALTSIPITVLIRGKFALVYAVGAGGGLILAGIQPSGTAGVLAVVTLAWLIIFQTASYMSYHHCEGTVNFTTDPYVCWLLYTPVVASLFVAEIVLALI